MSRAGVTSFRVPSSSGSWGSRTVCTLSHISQWETMVFLDVRDVIRNSRFSTFLKSPKKTWTKLELCKHTVPPNNLICYHVKPHWPFTFTFQYRIKGEIQQAQIAQLEINTQFYDYSGIFGWVQPEVFRDRPPKIPVTLSFYFTSL